MKVAASQSGVPGILVQVSKPFGPETVEDSPGNYGQRRLQTPVVDVTNQTNLPQQVGADQEVP